MHEAPQVDSFGHGTQRIRCRIDVTWSPSRLYQIVTNTSVPHMNPKPIEDKPYDLARRLGDLVIIFDWMDNALNHREDRSQRKPKITLQYQTDNALRSASQGVRVTRTRRLLADSKECGESVDFICQRDDDAFGCCWNAVARAERLVMVGDRVGDARVLAVVERVIATHDALKLGELADHPGREVGFRETGGADAACLEYL